MASIFKMTFAASFIAASANASTIDFEGLAGGTVFTSFNVDGTTGTVSAFANNSSGTNDPIVFDTENPGSQSDGDPDLGSPFFDAFDGTGPGDNQNTSGADGANELYPGNVLVIEELPQDDRGPDTNPDDNGSGGWITFAFDEAVTINGFDIFDDVRDFNVFTDTLESTGNFDLDFNNQFRSFTDLGWEGVRVLTFDFGNSSGAIDNISFEVATVPVPAALPLLLVGLGGFSLVARRRKS